MNGIFRIAAAVPRLEVANPIFNAGEIASLYKKAAKSGAAAVVFPELSLTGATCGDLFFSRDLRNSTLEALERLLEVTVKHDALLIVGVPIFCEKFLYNCAAVLHKGELISLVAKQYPNTAESRYFASPVDTVEFEWRNVVYEIDGSPFFVSENGFGFGIEIGSEFDAVIPPSLILAAAGVPVIFNLGAFPELAGSASRRRSAIIEQSRRISGVYLMCGAGVHESSSAQLFAGRAMIAANGKVLAENSGFDRDNAVIYADIDMEMLEASRKSAMFSSDNQIDREFIEEVPSAPSDLKYFNLKKHPFVPENSDERNLRCQEILDIQSAALAKRLEYTGMKKMVLGLSGGLDSTLAALVCARCCEVVKRPTNEVIAVTMPGFGTGKRTKGNAEKLAATLGFDLRVIPIGEAVKRHFADIGHSGKPDATYENAQARERTQILMDVANLYNGIVIGTGDLSESALGWCTFGGDQMSMYNVNGSVPKTLIRPILEYVGTTCEPALGKILRDIAATPISPELLPPGDDGENCQLTENIVGSYELHDFFLYYWLKFGLEIDKIELFARHAFAGVYSENEIRKTLKIFFQRFLAFQFKRNSAPDGPQVGSVSLSPRGDWQMPSDVSDKVFLDKLNKNKDG